jgi:putative transposase
MQLVAGRTGQEFNQRKNRRGAFWEDRYHATAVETGNHLARCLVYIDTNMVRAGMVGHPAMWPFSGYNQIQVPRKKNVLIDYERLQMLLGLDSYEEVKSCHKNWVDAYLRDGQPTRREGWTQSIAVGSRPYVERVKELLGFRAKGREVAEGEEGYQLREALPRYGDAFDIKNDDMGSGNTFPWNTNNS